jgi:hypothetical protein
MKRKYLLPMILLTLCFSACYKEKTLIPTHLDSITEKFVFPQGTSRADTIFENIYKRYGVKLIYKDFTRQELNRSWLSPVSSSGLFSSECKWTHVTDARQLEDAANTLEKKVFRLLPDTIVKVALKSFPYMYLADGIQYVTASQEHLALYPVKALDAMTVNLELTSNLDNYRYRVFHPARILLEILIHACAAKMISMPDEFYAGINQYNDVLSYNQAEMAGEGTLRYASYWARQGNAPFVQNFSGRITIGKTSTYSSRQATAIPPLTSQNSDIAYFFLYLILDPHWEERFAPGGMFYNCPLLEYRINLFHSRMKNVYGIDLDLIRDKLYEGTSVNTSIDRIYIDNTTSPGDRDTYIYFGL